MNNNREQNGRQTTPHQQSSAPVDPRSKKGTLPVAATTSADDKICRRHIWGTCMKGTECRFRHELDYNSMRKNLKFCHIWQNKGVCDRAGCTYLHCTREEENLFMTTGQIPRVLAERYAAMSVYEYMRQPPPPPPPPPTVSSTPVRSAPPTYTAPAAMPTAPTPAEFDPSRPPPPLPTKRRSSDTNEAGTSSKLRKLDDPDILCTNCVQRGLRIEIFQQETNKRLQEEEKHRLNLKKKVEDFQNAKILLRSILSPKWYLILDNYIEGNQGNSLFSQPLTSASETSTVPRQLLVHLVECALGNGSSRNILESVQSTSRESSLLESLSNLGRRNSASSSASPDKLNALLEALRPSSVENDQRVPSEQRANAVGSGNGLRVANSGPAAGPRPLPSATPYAPSSTSVGHVQPPERPYYQPYPPPVPPPATAPQSASQPQPYYAQYAGVNGSAQYAAAAPPYTSGSGIMHYPESGASQTMHNARGSYLPSGGYPPYYAPPPYQ